MILWMVLVLCIAFILSIGIDRLMARFGVRSNDTSPNGLAALAERLERWSTERRRT